MEKIKFSYHLTICLLLTFNVSSFPTPKSTEISSLKLTTEKFQQLSSSTQTKISSASSSCPNSCYCDQDNLYVSCVGDDQWDSNLPLLPITVTRLEIKNYNLSSGFSSSSSLSLSSASSESLSESPSSTYLNLSNLKLLQELKLTSLSLTFLSDTTFDNLNHLERLDLSYNRLTNLGSAIFTPIRSTLRYVDLSSNHLQTIADSTFFGCISIEHLNLRSNQLTNITVNTFLGLVKLIYLNLDGNRLTTIELGSFLHLTRLGHLIISNNPISPATRFDSLSTKLKYVDLSNISLSTIPHGIDPFIRDLRLSGNTIGKISSGDFDNYLYLNVLVLDSNGLTSVETDSLGRLEYLIELWAKDNKLTSLPVDLPSSLRKLYLSQNQLTTIDSTIFSQLVNLERLDLSNNLITTIQPDSLTFTVNLIRINLSNNQLNNLTSVRWSVNLKSLDLSGNPIVFTDLISLTSTPNLEELKLSKIVTTSNLIVTTNCTTVYLNHLKKINLQESNNLAEQFMETVDCDHHNYGVDLIVPNLTELNLLGTRLKSLGNNNNQGKLIKLLFDNQLEQLSFDSQQLDCSLIVNQQFSFWLKSQHKTNGNRSITIQPSSETIKCDSPKQFKGLPLIKLQDHINNNTSNITLINNNQLALTTTTTTTFANDDDNTPTSSMLPKGLIQVNLSSSSSSSNHHHHVDTKLNHSKDYASSDLHLNHSTTTTTTTINNHNHNDQNHHQLMIINGNISRITNGKHDQPSTSTDSQFNLSSSSGQSNVILSHDNVFPPQILYNHNSSRTDDNIALGQEKVSSSSSTDNITINVNKHHNLSSQTNLTSKDDNNNIDEDNNKGSSIKLLANGKSRVDEIINNSSRLSENFKRSISLKPSSASSSPVSSSLSSSSSSSSVPLTLQSTSSSSSGLLLLPSSSSSFSSSYQPLLPSLSTASLSSSSSQSTVSTASSSSHLVSYGIASFIIGSLIITTMLCLAILTMIKSRKIYSSMMKDTRVDNRSWLHRSVSYLSSNDEVSFLSLTDTVDLNSTIGSGGNERVGGGGLR